MTSIYGPTISVCSRVMCYLIQLEYLLEANRTSLVEGSTEELAFTLKELNISFVRCRGDVE